MAFVRLLETYNREINANRGSSTHTELELRFTVRSLDEYKRLLLGVLADAEISSVAYSVAIIKRNKTMASGMPYTQPRGNDANKTNAKVPMHPQEPDKIATREYNDISGKMVKSEVLTYSTKKRLALENVTNEFVEYRLAISAEAPSTEFDYKLFTVLRLKLRLSVILTDMPDWRFDFTLVDELTSLTPDFTKRRDTLFAPGLSGENFISNAPFEAAKHYEFEVEYTGTSSLVVPDVYQIIDYVRAAGGFGNSQGARYQEVIYEIAKLMYPPGKAANFRAKQGRKALGPSVVGLTREVYFREVLPRIVGMRVTIKLNGEGMIGKIVGSTVEAVSGILIEAKSASPAPNPIVYDSEFISGKQHVFDVYVYDKQNLLDIADLGVRDGYISKVAEILGPDIAVAKVHTILTENYAQELTDLWEKRGPGELPADGLIFDNRLKWKPEAEMTVDFLTMRADDAFPNKYILFAGMNKTQSREYNIRPLPGYNKIFRGRSFHDYFPIQFAPGDKSDAYMFDGSDVKENLHNRICEYSYDPSKKSETSSLPGTSLWKFHRIRTDRDVEVARGSYFGNNIAVAIATWNSIHDPLTFDMLRSSVADAPESSTGYFGTTDQKYASANKFSSYVKEQSIAPFKRMSWVIDLACGRGADIGRWSRLGIKTALCVDNDAEALKELMSRHLGNQRKMHHYKLGVAVLKANLNDPHEAQVNAFRAGAPAMPPGVPLIVCNMAIHYMCQSDASIWNFVMLVDRLLEVGGHFIFTSYNGARIFDLLGDKEQVDFMEGTNVKYSIKRDYKPTGGFKNFGQEIKPLLGCAGGMYVSEYLVNIAYLVRMFARRGFKLVAQVRFDSMLSTYSIDNIENYDKLDDADHEHLGLYDYIVLQKEKAIASEPIEMKPEEIVNIVSLPGKDAGVPVRNNEISAAALIIPGPAIEQLPTKDIRASINVKNAPDISAGRVSVIILPNRKFPGPPKIKKDGTVAKKIPQHEITPGDRLEINNEFEVVVEEVAIVSTYVHLPDKFSIASLSTTAKTREEWVLQFQEQNAALVGFELMGLRVRKL